MSIRNKEIERSLVPRIIQTLSSHSYHFYRAFSEWRELVERQNLLVEIYVYFLLEVRKIRIQDEFQYQWPLFCFWYKNFDWWVVALVAWLMSLVFLLSSHYDFSLTLSFWNVWSTEESVKHRTRINQYNCIHQNDNRKGTIYREDNKPLARIPLVDDNFHWLFRPSSNVKFFMCRA